MLSSGSSLERRSQLKFWLTCFLSTAAAMILINGIQDRKKIAITAFTSSSLAVVISVLIKNHD